MLVDGSGMVGIAGKTPCGIIVGDEDKAITGEPGETGSSNISSTDRIDIDFSRVGDGVLGRFVANGSSSGFIWSANKDDGSTFGSTISKRPFSAGGSEVLKGSLPSSSLSDIASPKGSSGSIIIEGALDRLPFGELNGSCIAVLEVALDREAPNGSLSGFDRTAGTLEVSTNGSAAPVRAGRDCSS